MVVKSQSPNPDSRPAARSLTALASRGARHAVLKQRFMNGKMPSRPGQPGRRPASGLATRPDLPAVRTGRPCKAINGIGRRNRGRGWRSRKTSDTHLHKIRLTWPRIAPNGFKPHSDDRERHFTCDVLPLFPLSSSIRAQSMPTPSQTISVVPSDGPAGRGVVTSGASWFELHRSAHDLERRSRPARPSTSAIQGSLGDGPFHRLARVEPAQARGNGRPLPLPSSPRVAVAAPVRFKSLARPTPSLIKLLSNFNCPAAGGLAVS